MTPVYIANKPETVANLPAGSEVIANLPAGSAVIANLPAGSEIIASNLQQEAFTHFHPVIQSDHAYIHAGYGFNYPCSFSLAGNAVKGCIIIPPASNGYIHWRPTEVSSSATAVKMELYESPTYTGGTALSGIVNKNRNSEITPTTVLKDGNLTITDNGTLITNTIFGSEGNVQARSGGAAGSENEIIFKPGLEYLLLFTNLVNATTTINATLFWYEEETG
jgi:hypothetical protein